MSANGVQPSVVGRGGLAKLIELVRSHTYLYDVTDGRHRDAQLIYNIWENIAKGS